MKCQMVWPTKPKPKKHSHKPYNQPCQNVAKHRVKIKIPSNIYAGLYEMGKKYECYNVCDKHLEEVKKYPNVQILESLEKPKEKITIILDEDDNILYQSTDFESVQSFWESLGHTSWLSEGYTFHDRKE